MADTRKGKVKEVSAEELRRHLSKGDEDNDDRRYNERRPARLAVEIPLATWDELRRVYTTNISKGGLLFSIESPVTLPATIDLTITLPDKETIVLRSEVRHVEPREGTNEFEVGVQFKPLDEATTKAIEQAVSHLDDA